MVPARSARVPVNPHHSIGGGNVPNPAVVPASGQPSALQPPLPLASSPVNVTRPPFRAADVPTFDPRLSSVDDWLFQVDSLFAAEAPGVTSRTKVTFATTRLLGSALTWWRSEVSSGRAASILEDHDPWRAFANAIGVVYAPLDAAQRARDRLWTLRHMTLVQPLIDQMRSAFLVIGDISEADRIDRFIHALRAPFAAFVRRGRPATFDDAARLALDYEATQPLSFPSAESHPLSSRPYLRKRNKGARFNGRWRNPSSVKSGVPVAMALSMGAGQPSMLTGDRRPQFRPTTNSQRRCYKCGKLGHIAKECRGTTTTLNTIDVSVPASDSLVTDTEALQPTRKSQQPDGK